MIALTEQARRVASGAISPAELVEEALVAVERAQRSFNAFTHIFQESARAAAASPKDGPLRGVPVAVKELYDVAGAPTTGCCAAYAGRIASSDSAVVERLRAAGAVIVAKTNQHELAYGGTSLVSSFGPVGNPWGEGRTAGGSSGGSGAAVAAGAVPLAMGSDTAGSIRHPASFCGVTGLKTTHGAVSMFGMMPMAPSLDSAGPIAVTAEDCALTLRVLAGYDERDPSSRPGPFLPAREVRGLRIGIATNHLDRIAAETHRSVRDAEETLRSLGAVVIDVIAPEPSEGVLALGPVFASEFADAYRDLWGDDRVDEDGRRLLDIGRAMPAPDLAAAYRAMRSLRRAYDLLFERCDIVVSPATPYPAPRNDSAEIDVEGGTAPNLDVDYARFSTPVNAAGLPSLVLPAGFSTEGLPTAVQLVGPAWSEETLLAAGIAFQRETEWHGRTPPGR